MKVLLDLNVLLDVVQDRIPHYRDSAEILAEAARCDYIITRNEPDFLGSPVPVLSPTAFLAIPAAKYI